MMKKLIVALMIAALCLTGAAMAKTYTDRDHDLTFEYDENFFEISMEDETDDELLVILSAKDPALTDTGIRFHLADLDDGETFPTLADFADIEQSLGTKVEQGEWNGFKDVFSYDIPGDEVYESVFIVPVYDDDDDDHDVEDILTINISATKLDDEEAAMARDDALSAVLDTLKVLDD